MGEGDGELGVAGDLGGLAVEADGGGLAGFDLDLAGGDGLAEGLDHGLLGGEPGRQVAAGTGSLAGVGELGGGEDAVGESRAPLQGAFDSFDLDQVDAHSERHDRMIAYFRPRTALPSKFPSLSPEPSTRKSSALVYGLA